MAIVVLPRALVELFPGAIYENRFGTVLVRVEGEGVEVTTFRSDHDYADFRRPSRVEFGDRIDQIDMRIGKIIRAGRRRNDLVPIH